MTCCPASTTVKSATGPTGAAGPDVLARTNSDGTRTMEFLLPTIHCGGCVATIEKTLRDTAGVNAARVNLSTKRLVVDWQPETVTGQELADTVEALGYDIHPFDDAEKGDAAAQKAASDLLRSLAVAGFAAANIMLLSVSVWSGAEGSVKSLFQWLSALIAMPAVIYAGRPFYRSAIRALSGGHLNMDVPISLAVILSAGLSLYETMAGNGEVWFDASVTLLFFLLAGRYLDHMMRDRARSAVSQLVSLNPTGATRVLDDGSHVFVPASELETGMTVFVAVGETVPVDGVILEGSSDLNRALVTGESLPVHLSRGQPVEGGTTNLTGPLKIQVTKTGRDTFLGEVISLMETAEQGKARFVRLADKVASYYAPVVHLLAAAAFVGWMIYSGGDWRLSIYTAVAVLIITCPCALGLAVPAVQIVANGLLFQRGLLVKQASALERLTDIDTVVFDKTGTLTTGEFNLNKTVHLDNEFAEVTCLKIADRLAAGSTHPLSRALTKALGRASHDDVTLTDISEEAGNGLRARFGKCEVRLGRPGWAGQAQPQGQAAGSIVQLSINGKAVMQFEFADTIRPGARELISSLKSQGLGVAMISGDNGGAVNAVAGQLGIDQWHSDLKPADKVGYIEQAVSNGHKVLMVGDGINDAPALAAATASFAPASASNIGRAAADIVFTSPNLTTLNYALNTARAATRLVKQNFALAFLYNVIAVPLALTGYATPLIAAIAMSSSSILVTSNAFRLHFTANGSTKPRAEKPEPSSPTAPNMAHGL